jgi:hypothetical protein
MATYKMLGRNEFPSTDPTRIGKTEVVYAYIDEAMRTITFTLHGEDDNPANVERELRARIENATKAGPKEITIG